MSTSQYSNSSGSAAFRKSMQWMPPSGGMKPPSHENGKNIPRDTAPAERGIRRPETERRIIPWLIIGGGIHGTYLSHYLTGRMGLPAEAVRVLDPYPEPLERWKFCAANTGMQVLRSPAPHHLDVVSLSLKRMAASDENGGNGKTPGHAPPLNEPYGRPSLELFNRHADSVVTKNALSSLRIRGRAVGIEEEAGIYRVRYTRSTDNEAPQPLAARNVILAIGMGEETFWPEWAKRLSAAGANIAHVFDPGFHPEAFLPKEKTASGSGERRPVSVVGSGLSGVQLALRLAREYRGKVTLIGRKMPEVHLFDSDREWQGRNRMEAFSRIESPEARRKIITRERHRGSVTPEIAEELEKAINDGSLEFIETEITAARFTGEGLQRSGAGGILLETAGGAIRTGSVILATGFTLRRPGRWLDAAVKQMNLPTASCGFPVVSRHLEWKPGLFVTGALAELELGPVARNISGVHRAAVRIADRISAAGF